MLDSRKMQRSSKLPPSGGLMLQDVSLYSSGSDDDWVLMAPASQSPTSPIIVQAQQALKQVQVPYGSCLLYV